MLPEEEAWDPGAGANPVCPGVHLEERVEDNRVRNPIANRWQGLSEVLKENTLLFLELKERKEECLGTKGHPWSKDNASPTTGASDYYPKCIAHG